MNGLSPPSLRERSARLIRLLALLLAPALVLVGPRPELASSDTVVPAAESPCRLSLVASKEAWKSLPPAEKGTGQPLPVWARALAPLLPHTTAAMLELDFRQR